MPGPKTLRNGLPEVVAVRDLLERICEGAGAFSRDPLVHAENTIESMKSDARAALLLLDSVLDRVSLAILEDEQEEER